MKNSEIIWKGFLIESYNYINPKGIMAHFKFLVALPKVFCKFYLLQKRGK